MEWLLCTITVNSVGENKTTFHSHHRGEVATETALERQPKEIGRKGDYLHNLTGKCEDEGIKMPFL